jgi:hypothetical protein
VRGDLPFAEHARTVACVPQHLCKRRFVEWESTGSRCCEHAAANRVNTDARRQTPSHHGRPTSRTAVPGAVPVGECHAFLCKPCQVGCFHPSPVTAVPTRRRASGAEIDLVVPEVVLHACA